MRNSCVHIEGHPADAMAAASSIIQPYDLTQPRPRLGSSVSDVDTDVQFEPSYVKTVARLNEFYGQGESMSACVYKQLIVLCMIFSLSM